MTQRRRNKMDEWTIFLNIFKNAKLQSKIAFTRWLSESNLSDNFKSKFANYLILNQEYDLLDIFSEQKEAEEFALLDLNNDFFVLEI